MIANTINGTIKTFSKIPKVFSLKPNVFGYDKLDHQYIILMGLGN